MFYLRNQIQWIKGIVKLVCVSAATNHIPVVGVDSITLANAKQVKRQLQ